MATAELDIRINSGQVANARGQLDRLTKSGGSAESAIGGLVAQAAGLLSVGAAMSKLVSAARNFDQLNAGLITMTGSSENAAKAFAELDKFASKTPYTLDQSVKGFTQLVALGLDPSQKAMESYGNTAAAMGKDLSQMIEAVADASTGEFERLKEFGIKAQSQGDKISFTFQGVTTTVAKNSKEIEQYLQNIGNTEFAGAMANRMGTLDGALSNLQDSWDGLFRAISSAGTGDAIAEQVRAAIDMLDNLNAAISSGEALALINAWGGQWESTFGDIQTAIDEADKFLTSTLNEWGVTAESSSSFMSQAFWEFPANIRAAIQIATVELAGFVDKSKAYAEVYARAWDPRNLFKEGGITGDLDQQLAAINQNVLSTSSSILAERDKQIAKLGVETAAAQKLREEYDKSKAAGGVDLGQYRKTPAQPTGGTDTTSALAKKAADAAQKKREIQLNALAQQQQDEADDYAQRLAAAGEFNARIEALNYNSAQKAATERSARMVENQANYNNGLITEEQYQQNLTAIKQAYAADRAEIDRQEMEKQQQAQQQVADLMIQQTQLTTSTITDLLQNSGKDNSALMQVMLAAQQALAIPSIIVSTEQAAMAAMAQQTMLGGLLAGTTAANLIRAQGAISVGIVAGQALGKFAGAFDSGGNIPTGSFGIVGENGPEIVQGPANVTSRKKTAALAAAAGESGATYVTNNVYQTITGNGDEALAKVVNQATQNALNQTQADFAQNGRLRRTLGV